MALNQCYLTNDETTEQTLEETTQQTTELTAKPTKDNTLIVIVVIIIITVVVIAVIVGIMYVLKRRKDKPKTTSQSGITQTTEKSYPVYPKGSITDDIDRYHNRFIQSNTESTATTKTSVKSEAKAKKNKGIRSVVSPPKNASTVTSINMTSNSKPKTSYSISNIEIKEKVSPPNKTSVKSPKRTSAKTNLI